MSFREKISNFLENSHQECEEIMRSFLSSYRLVPHNLNGISPTLWLAMWPEFEENVSLNEDAYSGFYNCFRAFQLNIKIQRSQEIRVFFFHLSFGKWYFTLFLFHFPIQVPVKGCFPGLTRGENESFASHERP